MTRSGMLVLSRLVTRSIVMVLFSFLTHSKDLVLSRCVVRFLLLVLSSLLTRSQQLVLFLLVTRSAFCGSLTGCDSFSISGSL